MKRIIFLAAAVVLLFGFSLAESTRTPGVQDSSQSQTPPATAPQASPQGSGAQSKPAAGQEQAQPPRIAPGSVIPVQLTKTVDAKKAKTGDEVVAKVTQDMANQKGEVLVPKDTKVIGHVTEAQPRNKQQKESELAIAFDRAVMRDGNTVQLPMSIQAVIGPQNNSANNAGSAPSGNYPQQSPNNGGGMPAGPGAGRTGGMGGTSSQSGNQAGAATPPEPNNPPAARPVINGQTQGVIGLSDVTLSSGQNDNQGSLLTSEKNNVKLESGTLLLLKVKAQ